MPDLKTIYLHVLCALFGLGAWVTINALFTQLPLLVMHAPEQWTLPSYLSLIIQIANIGPIVYSLALKRFNDRLFILITMIFGSISMLLMAFLYGYDTVLFGKKYSLALFILVFCTSLVCCTSSVLFIPFMNNFHEQFLFSYMIGEGLSGFVPSIISLIQGVGGNPKCEKGPDGLIPVVTPPLFSCTAFFIIIFLLMCISTLSFYLLNNSLEKTRNSVGIESSLSDDREPIISSADSPSTAKYFILFLAISCISAFSNGALPSIQSYSTLPYGNLAYHFAVNLSNMANPIACFVSQFLPITSLYIFLPSLLITCCLIVYVFTIALLSPNPPLQSSISGGIITVIMWTLCTGLISFTKMSLARMFRNQGKPGLFWFGAGSQIGAALGAIVVFVLVNDIHLFHSYSPC